MSHESLLPNLCSFHIIEKIRNRFIFTWSYPSVSNLDKKFLESKLHLMSDNNFVYFCNQNKWMYILNIRDIYLCLMSDDFQPQKYYPMCKAFIKEYFEKKNPSDLVKLFVDIVIQGSSPLVDSCSMISSLEMDSTSLKVLVSEFGLGIIFIFNGLLLKKRLLVYHKSLHEVQKALNLFAKLMEYRNPSSYIIPYLENVHSLQGKSFFMTAVTTECDHFENIYDLYVNLITKEIKVAPHAKNIFLMCKFHKEIATSLTKLSESKETKDEDLAEESLKRTLELVNYIHKISNIKTDGKKMITIESLRDKKLGNVVENFIFNLAVAENMMVF